MGEAVTVTSALLAEELDDVYVFHARRLRDGVQLQDTARFRDASWPLAPVTLQRQGRGLVLHFETVPPRYRHALKLLCYLALSGPLPPGEPRPQITSVLGIFYRLRIFLRWLDDTQKTGDSQPVARHLCDVTPGQLAAFQHHLLRKYRNGEYRRSHRSGVQYFWRYRRSLGADGFAFDPRQVADWTEPETTRHGENTTARIPEAVHSRLLVWAFRFVDDFSGDILCAIETWQQQHPRGPRPYSTSGRGRNNGLAEQIREYLDVRIRENRPLPGRDGRASNLAIARAVGCAPESLERHQEAIRTAVSQVGVSELAQLDLSTAGLLDGQPWLDGIAVEPCSENSLTVLAPMLQAACYIVIAFLSGMRDSEVKHLRRGCVEVRRDGNGHPYRWQVKGRAFKGENDPAGTHATWTIGDPAARAIAVLERAQGSRTDWLFGALRGGSGAGPAGRSGNAALTLASTNGQLNRFVRWVNEYCQARGRDDAIPNVDGQPWNVTTRQFRRTLAWYIARRPGGTIAGAIAYRHHSLQMFEGYAGTSDSGFRAEVEAEEALARAEHLLAMIDRHEHKTLVGPAAADAQQRLTELAERARFAGAVITDRHRLQRLMKQHEPAIYPGRYVTCVYEHAKAQCRPQIGSDGSSTAPDLAGCKPLTCRNVALTADNLAAWREELTIIESDLAGHPLLPPYLQAQLERRLEEIRRHLSNTDKEPS
jgi:hypothetical protein